MLIAHMLRRNRIDQEVERMDLRIPGLGDSVEKWVEVERDVRQQKSRPMINENCRNSFTVHYHSFKVRDIIEGTLKS